MFYHQRYSQTDLDRGPDFDKLGEAFGVPTVHIDKPEQVDGAILWALEQKGPSMIICDIPIDDKVFPMVAPGSSIEDVMMEEE